jgi:hypothetical protein
MYSYSLRKIFKPTFNIEQFAQQLISKMSNEQDQLAKKVTTFEAENKYSKFGVIKSNLIVIGISSLFTNHYLSFLISRLFNVC